MEIKFLGHAGFLINTEEGKKIAIDPFLTNNPVAVSKVEELKVDLVVVSHGHFDHLGDAITLAKQSDCEIVSIVEVCKYCSSQGAKTHGMQIGGAFDFGFVKIKLTMALHTSSIGDNPIMYLGNPCGILLSLEGKTLYHAGDTGIFGDMALIGRLNSIDLAMLPIGDNFTMGPEDALEAVKMLKPNSVVPIHYNTWDIIKQDPEKFKRQVEAETDSQVIILEPGKSVKLK